MKVTHVTRGRRPHAREHDVASLLAALIVLIVVSDILLTRSM